jgi:hypothetical protein
MAQLILKRAAKTGSSEDDYDLLEKGVVVGRTMKIYAAPESTPWNAGLRAPQRPMADARLRADARDRYAGAREELALGGVRRPKCAAIEWPPAPRMSKANSAPLRRGIFLLGRANSVDV